MAVREGVVLRVLQVAAESLELKEGSRKDEAGERNGTSYAVEF